MRVQQSAITCLSFFDKNKKVFGKVKKIFEYILVLSYFVKEIAC